jgi:hypothetical protein
MYLTDNLSFKEYFNNMAKKRKDGKVFNCYLTTQIYDLLHDYSIKKGYTMTMIMEKAIEYYLKNKKADE